MRDGWRLALGTLTAVPGPAPSYVDGRVAARAALLAPLAAAPLGLAAGLVAWLGVTLGLAPLAVAVLVVATVVAGSRALHVDGLADTADGLTASYDPERSRAVMRTGDTGPAGATAIVLVLGIQAGAVVALLDLPRGPVVIGVLVALARVGHSPACRRGVPSISSGLGAAYAHSLTLPAVVALWAAAAATAGAVLEWAGIPWWHAPAGFAVAALAVLLLVRRAGARLGGVNGDVFGAAIEITLACLLVAAT